MKDASLVRWFVLRPADSTLQWFDEELAQEMFRSSLAAGMYSYLKVKEAKVPLPSAAGYISGMPNQYGITLDQAFIRWAAAEGVSETIIAAVSLLHEKSVEEVAAKLGQSPG